MVPDVPPVVIEALTKRLGGVLAVDDLNLTVERGQIVGLAGPNGAGKSVTLKILLGLIRPTSGRVMLFGDPAHAGAPALGRVGTLVDGPGFVPHLSGLENLRLACRGRKDVDPTAELDRAVAIAGLGEAINRKYHTYSHGMRYRLGLAQALLGRPELLVLDEPTTGLDPAHIQEIRRVIAEAAADGATVLFSSHLLSEVEHICTHVAVMRRGRLVAAGTVDQLLHRTSSVSFEVDRPDRAAVALDALPATLATEIGSGVVNVEGTALRPAELLTALDDAAVVVHGFRRGRSLEQAYLDLVTDEVTSPPADRSPDP